MFYVVSDMLPHVQNNGYLNFGGLRRFEIRGRLGEMFAIFK